jgi:O-antigen/teichoic acid export membrane protein
MQPLSKFFSDIVKSIGSSGAQLIITIITTPLMTRLYDPEAYSSFGIVHTLAIAMVGLGLLSLPSAYCLEKQPEKRSEILQVMGILLLLCWPWE